MASFEQHRCGTPTLACCVTNCDFVVCVQDSPFFGSLHTQGVFKHTDSLSWGRYIYYACTAVVYLFYLGLFGFSTFWATRLWRRMENQRRMVSATHLHTPTQYTAPLIQCVLRWVG